MSDTRSLEGSPCRAIGPSQAMRVKPLARLSGTSGRPGRRGLVQMTSRAGTNILYDTHCSAQQPTLSKNLTTGQTSAESTLWP